MDIGSWCPLDVLRFCIYIGTMLVCKISYNVLVGRALLKSARAARAAIVEVARPWEIPSPREGTRVALYQQPRTSANASLSSAE